MKNAQFEQMEGYGWNQVVYSNMGSGMSFVLNELNALKQADDAEAVVVDVGSSALDLRT